LKSTRLTKETLKTNYEEATKELRNYEEARLEPFKNNKELKNIQ